MLPMKRMRGRFTKTQKHRQGLAGLKNFTYYKASIGLLSLLPP